MLQDQWARLEELYPELVTIRRDLHMFPELSFQEEKTPQKVACFLEDLGLEVRTKVGGNGVVAWLRGGKPGKTIALRADFDALPIQDEKNVSYRSRVPGVMHACGHDIHTAVLMGLAKVLKQFQAEIAGNIVFIHQFAEEQPPGGARSMIEDGCLKGVDVIYGAHVWTSIPVGTVGIMEGKAMALGDRFEVEIQGKGGHGGKPQGTVDALLVGTQLVNNLQQIVSRRIDPLQAAVVSVGTFAAGQAFNIIADKARMSGTVRALDEKVRDTVETSIRQIAQATAQAAGAEAVVDYQRGYPALMNHAEPLKRAEQCAKALLGVENVRNLPPSMGIEDFSYYLQNVPGAFFFVGGGNEAIDAVYPQHHPKYDVDEHVILVAGKLFLAIIADYLEGSL